MALVTKKIPADREVHAAYQTLAGIHTIAKFKCCA